MAAKNCFRPYTARTFDLVGDLRQPIGKLAERAAAYRAAMRELRSPARIIDDFIAQANSAGIGGGAAR
jgi:hypothetical protein